MENDQLSILLAARYTKPTTPLHPPTPIAAVVADQNAKLSIFATRPAIYTPVFNFVTELLATVALVFGALMMYARRDLLAGDARDVFRSYEGEGGWVGGCSPVCQQSVEGGPCAALLWLPASHPLLTQAELGAGRPPTHPTTYPPASLLHPLSGMWIGFFVFVCILGLVRNRGWDAMGRGGLGPRVFYPRVSGAGHCQALAGLCLAQLGRAAPSEGPGGPSPAPPLSAGWAPWPRRQPRPGVVRLISEGVTGRSPCPAPVCRVDPLALQPTRPVTSRPASHTPCCPSRVSRAVQQLGLGVWSLICRSAAACKQGCLLSEHRPTHPPH